MKKTLTLILVLALVIALSVSLAGCQRKVTVRTGEIIICTAGEIIEDNTSEIEVPENKVDEYGVTTKVITCDAHGDVGLLYDEAQQAIAVGDLTTARERLATVIERDPTYRKAKEQLAAIDAGTTPQVDAGDETADTGGTTPAPGGTTPPADPATEEPTGPVVSLTTYVPDTIDGYVAQGIIADMASLNRQYLPTSNAADQLIIEVEQRVNADAAEAAQAAVAGDYPDSATSRTIDGKTVVAGVHGEYAAAIFVDGSLTVIVELHSTGSSGANLIDAAFAVVESITK